MESWADRACALKCCTGVFAGVHLAKALELQRPHDPTVLTAAFVKTILDQENMVINHKTVC
jgi:hypothetical protein